MPLFYERQETSDTIELKFRHLPWLYMAMLIAVVLSLVSRGQWTNTCMGGFAILVIVWMIGMWKPVWQVKRAMSQDGVVISGCKFSFRNPLRIVINK